jgi:hypothetical protein
MKTPELAELAVRIARSNPTLRPYQIGTLVDTLIKLARRYQRLAIAECNRPLTPREVAAQVRTAAQLRALVAPFAAVSFDGDPRGHVVVVVVDDSSNRWAGAGWGIC